MIRIVQFDRVHAEQFGEWLGLAPMKAEVGHLEQIIEAHVAGRRVYAALRDMVLVGAVATNLGAVPPMFNLIWIHPSGRDGKVSVEVTRQVLRGLFREFTQVAVWQPNDRMRQVLVELGMAEKFNVACDFIEFDRGDLRL